MQINRGWKNENTCSIEEINEIKRKKMSKETQDLIIKLFCEEKMGVVKISEELFKLGMVYGRGVIRRFLVRNNLYVKLLKL